MRTVVVQTQDELNACLDIRREVFIQEQQVPLELEVDEYDQLGSEVTHVLLYDDEERAVATARLRPYQSGSVKVQRVAVRRTLRGQGYGECIMRELEHIATLQGYRKMVLDSQCHAVGFYQKLGYETVSDKFLEAGIEHVRMEKTIG